MGLFFSLSQERPCQPLNPQTHKLSTPAAQGIGVAFLCPALSSPDAPQLCLLSYSSTGNHQGWVSMAEQVEEALDARTKVYTGWTPWEATVWSSGQGTVQSQETQDLLRAVLCDLGQVTSPLCASVPRSACSAGLFRLSAL